MLAYILALLAALPAFPDCLGFGCNSVGGSGRHLSPPAATIFRVSSLADSGAGTLRECLEANGPRTCIFEVSGEIRAKNWLKILNPYITIAGETSPGGITVRGWNVMILTHDVILRQLRLRSGDDPDGAPPGNRRPLGVYGDNATAPGAWNVVIDRCSLSWAIDENFDTWYGGLHDISLTRSILAEPLYQSVHPQGPQSTAILIGDETQRISFVRLLLAHNFSRNPYYKAGSSSEMINCVVYHWGFGKDGHTGEWAMVDLSDYDQFRKTSIHSFIGNYFKPGSDSEKNFPPIFSSAGAIALPVGSHVFVRGNIGPGRMSATDPEWNITNGLPKPTYCTAVPPLSSGVQDVSSAVAFDEVLRDAGAFAKWRDPVDARIVQETKDGTGQFVNCVTGDGSDRCKANAGGWPVAPQNKVTHQLPANPFQLAANGYTNLENWLQTFPVQPPNPTPTPTPTPSPSPSVTPTPAPTGTPTPSPSFPPC
jgi:hypothetical protein